MNMKCSFNQILSLMANKRAYTRRLSMVLTFIMALQLAVVPAGAAWSDQTTTDPNAGSDAPLFAESILPNTYALVVATGGQSGESLQYFKVIYEDTYGIRRSEYILIDDNKTAWRLHSP